MSGNTQSQVGSTDSKHVSNATVVQRRARARQAPKDMHAGVPADSEAEADIDALFDDGELVNPDDFTRQTTSEPETAEEWLAEVAPERLARINEKVDELPGSREELINRQMKKVLEEAEEKDIQVTPTTGGSVPDFEITVKQDKWAKNRDIWAHIDQEEDGGHGGNVLEECPKCGAEDISAETVEIQTRAADESGTQITKTECGCTLRNYK